MMATQGHRRRSAIRLAVTLLAAAALGIATAPVAAAGTPTSAAAAADARALHHLINHERAAHGLAPLHWSTGLAAAARAHNARMARRNTLSHQLPGEPTLGARVSATGYQWRTLAENIGLTTRWSRTGVLNLERRMYGEVAPNDEHRRIILSRSFHDVGISVRMDAKHHRAWLTVDFGHTR